MWRLLRMPTSPTAGQAPPCLPSGCSCEYKAPFRLNNQSVTPHLLPLLLSLCASLSSTGSLYLPRERERETGASAFRHNAQLSAPRISCSTSLSARFDVDKQTDETLNRFVPTSLFDVTAPATDSASSGYAQENYGNSLRDFFAQLLKGFFFFVFYLCALETLKTWVFKVVFALWRAGSPATSSIAAAACC